VAPGVAEPSTMGGANAQGISCLYKRIFLIMAFLFLLVEIESSTSDKKSLAEAKKRLKHFIRQAHSLRFAVTTKNTISFFSFFSATFFFLRDEVNNILFFDNGRKKCLGQLRRKCFFFIRKDKDKVMEFLAKFIDLGGIGEFKKAIHIMIEIIVKNRIITYGYNPYLMNEEKKMQSLLSNRTKTYTFIKSVRIKYVYQSASLIAQEISFQLKKKKKSISFHF
jgi:small subunit ribosomal protein S3